MPQELSCKKQDRGVSLQEIRDVIGIIFVDQIANHNEIQKRFKGIEDILSGDIYVYVCVHVCMCMGACSSLSYLLIH